MKAERTKGAREMRILKGPGPLPAAAITLVMGLFGACTQDDSTMETPGSSEPSPAETAAPSPTPTTTQGIAASEVCFEEGGSFKGEARLYIEHNATDQDTGVHGQFDQEGLVAGCFQLPDGTEMMFVDPMKPLNSLGINEFFFESREPPADKYSIAELKADFPEGDYRISGIDFKGEQRVGTALFTHAIPKPPKIVRPRVVSEEKADRNIIPTRGLTIRWRPVKETIDGEPVEITAYEVIEPPGWYVFVEQPLERAFAPLYASMWRTALLLLVSLGIAVLVSLALARKMVIPIQALQAGVARVAAGHLDVSTRPPGAGRERAEARAVGGGGASDALRLSGAGELAVHQRRCQRPPAIPGGSRALRPQGD